MASRKLNTENLKPVRSTSEARERGQKGGIASGKARREKRIIRDCFEMLLSMPAEGDFEGDNTKAMCVAMVKKAIGGDVPAFTAIRDSVGEKPTDKLNLSGGLDLATAIEEGRKRVSSERS